MSRSRVAAASAEGTPDPLEHAAPDVELADAQLALGRPDLIDAGDAAEAEKEYEAGGDAEAEEEYEGGGAAEAGEKYKGRGAAEAEEEYERRDAAGAEEGYQLDVAAADGGSGGGGRAPIGTGGSGGGAEQPAGAGAIALGRRVPAEHKPSLLARLIAFLQGSWRELQRVQWPDRRQVVQATSVVIGFVIVAGVFLGLCDLAFSHLMNYILYGK